MAARREPRIRTVWLGRALQQMRLDADLTAKDIAAYIGRDQSTVSRMEDGKVPVSESILNGYMEACGVVDSHRQADMRRIRRDAANSGWWEGYEGDVAGVLMDHTWVESKATIAMTFDLAYIPGLLQTPDYARGIMTAVDPDADEDDLQRWLDLRMTRQHILTKHHPVGLCALIDLTVLRRQVTSATVMDRQLAHLLHVAEQSNIDIRILPTDRYLGISSSFEVFTLASPYPRIGYIAGPAGDVCVEGESVDRLYRQFERLKADSLSPSQTRDAILSERKSP